MLRNLQTKNGKVYDATYTAAVPMVVGMGVVKGYNNHTVGFPGVVKGYDNHTVGFPTEATDKGIFFATKEKIAKGVYAGLGEFSDYDEMFMNIEKDELVVLVSPERAERYATDQVVDGLAIGDYLAVGVDGKFAKSETATRFIYDGTKLVDTHTLHVIEVID